MATLVASDNRYTFRFFFFTFNIKSIFRFVCWMLDVLHATIPHYHPNNVPFNWIPNGNRIECVMRNICFDLMKWNEMKQKVSYRTLLTDYFRKHIQIILNALKISFIGQRSNQATKQSCVYIVIVCSFNR